MRAPTLQYEIVDVFTDVPYAGNPLAVVLDGDELTDGQMQTLAREFALSETAFPLAAAPLEYGLRIFTPAVELPFAGHPSVGAAWVLHRLGRIPAGNVTQVCGAGRLPVVVSSSGATITGGTPGCGEPLDPEPLLLAAGLSPDDLEGPPPRTAGVGIDFTYLLVNREALNRVQPDGGRLGAIPGVGLSVSAWDGTRARTRVLAAGVGVAEDPATGSAALGFGVFLATSGLLGDGAHTYVVDQGVEMGRPSRLECTIDVDGGSVVRTTVSGGVVPIARGEIRVPAA